MFDVFFCFALLASATIANAYCLKFLPLTVVAGLRMLVAGIILIVYYRNKTPRLRLSYIKHDALMLFAMSTLTMLVPALFKAYALKYMPTSKAAFFGSLDPYMAAIYAYLFWKEKLSFQKIIGICVGFVGVLILLISNSMQEQGHMMWWVFSYPEIAALMAVATGKLGWILVQRMLRKERYNAPEINGITMTISGVAAFVLPFVYVLGLVIAGALGFMTPLEDPCGYAWSFLSIEPSKITNWPFLIGALLHTIIVGNVIGYTLYSSFLRHHSVTFISLAGFSVPLYIYFFNVLRLAEPFSYNFLLAAAVTFAGMLIFYRAEIKRLIAEQNITH